jgi:hypothetical protein
VNYEVAEKKREPVRVALRETGEGLYEITIDGKAVHVDAVRSGPNIYSIIEDGQQFEAMVDEKGAHGFDVLVGGRIFHLDVIDERSKLLAASAALAVSGPQTVMAEMPGKVVKVNVAVGAEVRERQGIVVVEAMKMENEIPSDRRHRQGDRRRRRPDGRGRRDPVRGRTAEGVTPARPVLLDTDIGSDVDDALALALILAAPEALTLRAVTCVGGFASLRARIAAGLLALAGRREVDVCVKERARCCARPSAWRYTGTSRAISSTRRGPPSRTRRRRSASCARRARRPGSSSSASGRSRTSRARSRSTRSCRAASRACT